MPGKLAAERVSIWGDAFDTNANPVIRSNSPDPVSSADHTGSGKVTILVRPERKKESVENIKVKEIRLLHVRIQQYKEARTSYQQDKDREGKIPKEEKDTEGNSIGEAI